jgi:hypothetical protein
VANELLGKLLTLQQDGQSAISGPANWRNDLILEVRTSLDDVIDDLELSVKPSQADANIGRWHFFVGSPGNGKSAGAGKLVRRLHGRGDVIIDSSTGKSLDELGPSEVPYLLKVFEQGAKYPYLYIAQDASVLPDPFDSQADPAAALEELLQEAAVRGVSLVVCTNRGVIERLFSRSYLDPVKSSQGWFKAVKAAAGVSGDMQEKLVISHGDHKKSVFKSVEVRVTSLDKRSLLLANTTFESLVMKAVDAPEWEACNECPSRSLCPFKANRDWLAEPALRKNALRLFLHAELFDGQVIVLREALALLSFILAGCPHDYPSGSPCDWVHQRQSEGDIFALAGRRIYMQVFSSYSPLGLATYSQDAAAQKSALRVLLKPKFPVPLNESTKRAIQHAIAQKRSLSTDVGVQRLLGNKRTLAALDPFTDVLPQSFLDLWSETWAALQEAGTWKSGIEEACFACWSEMQKAAAATTELSSSDYRWLVRWITAFTIRAGALVEGKTTFCEDLDELVSILSMHGKPNQSQIELLKKIESTLALSLQPAEQGVSLAPSTSLHGEWVTRELRPHLPLGGNNREDAITAHLTFGSAKKMRIPLSTQAFVWLKRRADRKMSFSTFPSEYLETARDAMLRVAVTSGYDVQEDIVLDIKRPGDRPIKVTKSHGSTYINDE